MSRPLIAFGCVLGIGALGSWYLPLPRPAYWSFVLVAAALAALSARQGARRAGKSREFLCDTCKFNDSRYCHRPERPNAESCEDYSEAAAPPLDL